MGFTEREIKDMTIGSYPSIPKARTLPEVVAELRLMNHTRAADLLVEHQRAVTAPSEALVAFSQWVDTSPGYENCDPEAVLWRRVTKVASEAGEAIDALAGAVEENPRKGVTGDLGDVIHELLDAAVAALGAVEHLTNHQGTAREFLDQHILAVAQRAGLLTSEDDGA